MAPTDGLTASLVVIAHNEERRISSTITSILAQDVAAPFEVILVDDGSSDATIAVAGSAAAGDERFRVVALPANVGRGAARAAGVAAARAGVVGFVDADITLPADWLRRCLAELPGHAAVGGVAIPDGNVAVLARVSGARPRERGGSMPITGNNVLFERSVLDRVPFDPRDRLGEDFRHANRLLRGGHRLRRVPGLAVRHDEAKSYLAALRWRFENGIDAASHPREIGRLRLADLVWLGCLTAWLVAIAGALLSSPWWLAFGVGATAAAALVQVVLAFHARPVVPFLVAAALNVPLMAAYLLGRTVGIPRLLAGRR